MSRKASKPKKLPSKCSQCGAPIETVWKSNGEAVAVDKKPIDVIFANHAMAGAFPCHAWVKHVCKEKP
jgi:hypothetical protein